MRAIALALLLMGCATAQSGPPSDRLAGCWADTTQGGVSTLRWRPDPEGRLLGELRETPVNGAPWTGNFILRQAGEIWQVCDVSGQPCWTVAETREGSMEGGRAFIDRYRDRLHFSIVGADGRSVARFVGESAPCP